MTELSAEYQALANYRPTHKVRFVTAASLFDGHDAAINIMRRILQGMGAEVIHLGHNRSVNEVVTAALQEDVQGIALSSYQGGHLEYFKYMVDLLRSRGGADIQVFGGGGGVIVPAEIAELQAYGVARIYSPEDGQRMGLAGMIGEMMMRCDHDLSVHAPKSLAAIQGHSEAAWRALARLITDTIGDGWEDDLDRLRGLRSEEISRGVTTIGPHRDELRFLANQIDLGDYGSRGQIRTTLLSLKLAEVSWMKARTGQCPVILLDEVMAELDLGRRADLLKYLVETEQTLLTATDLNMFTPAFVDEARIWRVKTGTVQTQEN